MGPFRQIRERLGFTRYNAAKTLGMRQTAYDRLEASVQGYRYGYYLFRLLDESDITLTELRKMFAEMPSKVDKNPVDNA
jgi:hypothetical protein